ncbi:MAG: flagellar hook-length control protein FliK [Betaproteobacteria bacterium]
MDAALIPSTGSVSLPLPLDAGASAPPSAMQGADFANLLGHLMNRAERQDLAASGFQAVPIGQQIEVITAAEPLPDAASLLAFARGQGLDEATLRALFAEGEVLAQAGLASAEGKAQGSGAQALQTQALQVLGVQAPLQTVPAQLEPAPAQDPSLALTSALALNVNRPVYLPPGEVASTPNPPVQQPKALVDTAAIRPPWSLPIAEPTLPHTTLAQAGPPALDAGQSLDPAAAPALVVASPVPAVGAVLASAASQQVAAPQSQALSAAPAALASPVPSALAATAVPAQGVVLPTAVASQARVSDLRWQASAATQIEALNPADGPDSQGSEPPLMDVLRLRLAPQEALTRRLAAMTGTGAQLSWAAVSGQPAAMALLRLEVRDLGLLTPSAPAAPGIEAAVMDAEPLAASSPVALGPEGGRSAPSSPSAPSAPWVSTAAQRAEQYEQLAQRLGEALGQRLQSQLERGQWKMQMRLDPAHLGRIDLDLDMNSGALDAVFRSDNQITRDLIAQGLPRLKESLSQSGTAVANVWVQGDSSRQSGGNPTPRRAPEPREQAANHSQPSQDLPVQATGNRTRQGTSAWDVLA